MLHEITEKEYVKIMLNRELKRRWKTYVITWVPLVAIMILAMLSSNFSTLTKVILVFSVIPAYWFPIHFVSKIERRYKVLVANLSPF